MATTSDAKESSSRRYASPIREQRARETRDAVVAAAARQFLANGWAGAGMRGIARDAGVALETVYSHFPSKRALLNAVVDFAVVGDDQPIPLADRPEFTELGSGRRSDRIAAAARLLAAVHGRTSGFARVVREAAAGDREIDDLLQATRLRQRSDIEAAAGLITGRPAAAAQVDELWMLLSPDLYLLFVEVVGWSTRQYESWAATTIDRLLPDPEEAEHDSRRNRRTR